MLWVGSSNAYLAQMHSTCLAATVELSCSSYLCYFLGPQVSSHAKSAVHAAGVLLCVTCHQLLLRPSVKRPQQLLLLPLLRCDQQC